MGRFDSQIADTEKRLAKAEAEYANAVSSMASAAPHVRQFVLNEIQGRIDEARSMIETFRAHG